MRKKQRVLDKLADFFEHDFGRTGAGTAAEDV
jgi:hypothetical protein